MHLGRQGLIRDSRHGFMSCEFDRVFFKEVTKKTDEARVMDVVFLEFSKTTDKVLHGRLPGRLDHLGLRVS